MQVVAVGKHGVADVIDGFEVNVAIQKKSNALKSTLRRVTVDGVIDSS